MYKTWAAGNFLEFYISPFGKITSFQVVAGFQDPVHTNPFSNENGAVLLRLKKICVHTCRFRIVFARPHYNAVFVLKTLLHPQCACLNELDACACILIYRSAKLAQSWSHIAFWILTVEWSGARSCLFWWRHRIQIASFFTSTLENSVFKTHRFQIAPLWRVFSNGSVFGDRFRRCSLDDSRIRSKAAPFSLENGLVWTGPNESTGCLRYCRSWKNTLRRQKLDLKMRLTFFVVSTRHWSE